MKKLIDVTVMVQKKITAVLLFMMIMVIAVQIAARMVFHLPTPWTEEISKYLLIWIAFIGGVGALIKGEHMMVDILYVFFPPRLKKYARLLNDVIFIFFTGFLFVFGIELCVNPIVRRSVTPAMQVPRVWLYVIVPVSMAFMVLFSFYDLFLAVKAIAAAEKKEA